MNRNLSIIAFFIIATFLGLVLAVNIGQANYEQLGIYAFIGLVIYFFIHGWRNVWWFAALLIFSGVVFSHNFVITANHLFALMVALASVMAIISRGASPVPKEFKSAGTGAPMIAIGALLLYALLHFFGNYAFPYSPADYAVKNSTKAYFECFAPMAILFWMMVGPYSFNLKNNWIRGLIVVITFAVFGNVFARGYMYLMGFQASDGSGTVDEYFLHVPVINMQAGLYTLRLLSPMALVIILFIASAPGTWSRLPPWTKAVTILAVAFCFVGAILSGGRASVLFCLVLSLAVAFVRRQMVLLGILGCGLLGCISIANVFSYEINTQAPFYVARSLQVVMIEKGDSFESIEGSQETRNAAMKEALVQWQKDNRVFVFGRATYSVNAEEILWMKNNLGVDGFVENAMRSGATHNLITDLLLQYGLVGCVLYLIASLVAIRFFIRLYRTINPAQVLPKALAGSMAIYLPMFFIYSLLGGGFFPVIAALMAGLIRAHLVTFPTSETFDQESKKTAFSYFSGRLATDSPAFGQKLKQIH